MALSKPDRRKINAFLQTCVDQWRENNGAKPFSIHDLMGGTVGGPDWQWEGTELYPLWQREKHKGKRDHKANEYALKAARNMLKQIVFRDPHNYVSEVKPEQKLRFFIWDGQPPKIVDPEEEEEKRREAQRQRSRKAFAAKKQREAIEAKDAAKKEAEKLAAKKAKRAAAKKTGGRKKFSPRGSRKRPLVVTKKKRRRIVKKDVDGNR